MAWNKHLDNADYKRIAQAIVDNVPWSSHDLPSAAYAVVTDRLGRESNEAELGEIWTHVIGIDTKYAVLTEFDTEERFLEFGTEVQYDEPEETEGEKEETPDADEVPCGPFS